MFYDFYLTWKLLTVSNVFTQEVIPTFDMAVNEIFFDRYPDSILEHQIQVRPYNALKTRNMRSLNPEGTLLITVLVKNLKVLYNFTAC